jgi:hypothetical protein
MTYPVIGRLINRAAASLPKTLPGVTPAKAGVQKKAKTLDSCWSLSHTGYGAGMTYLMLKRFL